VAIATAAATWLGWWAPLAVGAAYGLIASRAAEAPRPSAAAAGAAVAWGALLLLDAAGGRMGALLDVLDGVLRAPAAALLLGTVGFAALSAWGSATLAAELARMLSGRRAAARTPSHG
jgi:hypothetical protein